MVAISTKHIGQTVWLWPVRVHAYCCRTRKTALVITEAQESRKITRQSALPTGRNLSSHVPARGKLRSEEHTSELQSLMRISYAVFCLKQHTSLLHITTNTHAHR